ncbi:MAG TPA: non-reducing end alpha-L-arabinofuranosidase family hydrolase [Asticcacaulis sp.]|nr:non-reducing end alpha-L-arabinofuranosidase family hydrolase [Asticcacaulis sp.]
MPTQPIKKHLGFVASIATALVFSASAGLCAPAEDFHWTSSPPLIVPPADPTQALYGVKDPSIVYANGKYHVFMTTAGAKGWGLAYTSFKDWAHAPAAPVVMLDTRSGIGAGYHAAPEVFYFAPQKLWYLIFQSGPPFYSTTTNIDDPTSWTAAKPFFNADPDVIKEATGKAEWLDFWVICDDYKCFLFNTDDGGRFYRSETGIDEFPNGFRNTTRIMDAANRDDVFEASNTYRLQGTDSYITLIEAIGPKGRYFRVWKSDRLDGNWESLGTAPMNRFAGADNVSFPGAAWSEGISHGELVRAGFDQTLTIDPCKPLQFLYQGLDPDTHEKDYIKLPYRLGVITADTPNPVSDMCSHLNP